MDTNTSETPRRRGRRAAAENAPPAGTGSATTEGQQEEQKAGEQSAETTRRTRRSAAENFTPPVGSGVSKDGQLQATASKETIELLEEYYREVERNEAAKKPLREQMKALQLSNSTVYRKVKALGIRKKAFQMGLYRRSLTKEEAASLDLENTIAARAAGVPIQADLFTGQSSEQPAAPDTIQ